MLLFVELQLSVMHHYYSAHEGKIATTRKAIICRSVALIKHINVFPPKSWPSVICTKLLVI